ncbi:uncharacterized protein BO97DRAFT_409535 [Aspergillus homomorphus CBS 101889]|uniref:Uncharacterized protein n=1 Tax=Aspergillus homomorphus (strain CBS 101889) TaxID=1450537 RepID=A0A395HGM2_ASPHC|nr:hypothetical protein BO97DRAFT_409535 [Aspergillus homomorphus CBS 101889]RAL06623.1 hypothetical protein BO97DRAFT_409535 [Aspergillus homomorphus CBS 101889]
MGSSQSPMSNGAVPRTVQLKPPGGKALDEAERIAGVRSRAGHDAESTIISVCIIRLPFSADGKWIDRDLWLQDLQAGDATDEDSAIAQSLRRRIAKGIGSTSLEFEPSSSGTLVNLSFEEAGLTPSLFAALEKEGITPGYIPYSPDNGMVTFTALT